jgi:hypothetical protein
MDEIVYKNDPATIRREAMCAAEYQIAASLVPDTRASSGGP